MNIEQGKILELSDLENIRNWGERIFATACIKIPHLQLKYQVPVNGKTSSVIDFEVLNLKSGRKKLVEVTVTPRNKILSTDRKLRQIKNLRLNGKPFTVLAMENLNSIQKHL